VTDPGTGTGSSGDASTGNDSDPAGGASGAGGSQEGGGGDDGPGPGPDPEGDGPDPGASDEGDVRTPNDPNDIVGPAGFGDAGYLDPGRTLPYTVDFENLSTADLPAQVVVVTDALGANLDWSTFQLGDFGFGQYQVHVPAGTASYSARIDARATRGLFVDVTAKFDAATGVATWTFTSIDPATGDQTGDTLAGFLPPDTAAHDGEGFVSYTVRPRAGLASGTTIGAQASVDFDTNDPLATPSISNAVDAARPSASVAALPAVVYGTQVPVSWTGADEAGGSGIADYTLYVSIDGGPLVSYLANTLSTSTVYPGQPGHTYGFAVAATDHVGHAQVVPA
jgi:uncharacterized repeat protein (TIGR01451 family)